MSASVKRLAAELKPVHYELRIVPDAKKMAFSGTVTVRLKKAGRPSQRLTFHQHGLKIESARIVKHDKKGPHELEVTRINNQDKLEEVRLHTSEMVYSGEYEVMMDFSGTITRNMNGLYPCFFMHEGKEHALLATQFESHYARQVFPCIDEPEAKATFQLTLVAPKGQMVLSNTPAESKKQLADSIETTFETTPRMSTYLLAFVIGELHKKSTKTKRGTEVSVWATVAQPAEALDFALDVGKRTIEFFEDYFGVPYPLAKADHVALPDFSSGAMENWGLITYRERVLLAYPDKTSQSTRETIALVVGHETSHQWFGNLVTMRWWDDLWLNESFANMMEYVVIDALFPEWHVWDEFIMHEGLSSLRRDATAGVQAVRTEVRHPDEIGALFDPTIVYAKGGRLLNMLRRYVGEEAFRKGLALYFKQHAYGNTTGDDLWQALKEASHEDVAAFMKPWLERSGFPVVSVDQDGQTVALAQEHFLDDGQKSDGRIWPVPVFSNDEGLPKRLDKAEQVCKLTGDELAYINEGSAGHFIVHYARPEHRAYVVELIRNKSLGTADRLMLLNSASMLAKAGYQSFGDVLHMLDAYGDESTEAVWSTIALIVGEARRFIDYDERLESRINVFVRQLIQQEYKRLGWDEKADESSLDRKLRGIILGLGAYAEDPAIVAEALRRFKLYKRDSESISPELRGILFSVAVKNKADDAFKYLLDLHDKTSSSELQADISAALSNTHDKEEAKQLLARLQDAKLVKPQDADHWLAFMLRNRHVRDIAWEWMVKEWPWIHDTYSHGMSYDYFPRYASGICNTRAWATKYRALFEPKLSELALRRNIEIGFNEIETRVKWLERDLAAVQEFFKK